MRKKWIIQVSGYAERGIRTPTPLRALEPESSASANSAISAKDNKIYVLRFMKSIDWTYEDEELPHPRVAEAGGGGPQ